MTLKVATGIYHATDQLYQTLSKFHHKQHSCLLQCRPVTLTLKVATGSYGPETNAGRTDNAVTLIIYASQFNNKSTGNSTHVSLC